MLLSEGPGLVQLYALCKVAVPWRLQALNNLGHANAGVAGDQRHSVRETGGCNEFVGWVRLKVQTAEVPADLGCNRPKLETGDGGSQRRVVQPVQDPALLIQLFDFPQHNCRNTPITVFRQHSTLLRFEVSGQSVQQDVGIEIQQPDSESQRSPVENRSSSIFPRTGIVPIRSAQEPGRTGSSLATAWPCLVMRRPSAGKLSIRDRHF